MKNYSHKDYCREWQREKRKNPEVREKERINASKNYYNNIDALRENNRLRRLISYFGGNRDSVLKRDKYKCASCGLSAIDHISKYGREISIHHIDKNKKNNKVINLVTLCSACHTKIHLSKKVLRVNDGKTYCSLSDAARDIGISVNSIYIACSVKNASAGGYRFKYI